MASSRREAASTCRIPILLPSFRARKAAARAASLISAADIGKIAKGKKPGANGSLVETLKGGDYYRVWINRGGNNYIINLATGS